MSEPLHVVKFINSPVLKNGDRMSILTSAPVLMGAPVLVERPVLTFIVPLPPHELAPNARVYRMKKSAIHAEYRDHVIALTQNAVAMHGWTPPARARISMHWGVLRPKRKRGAPGDNLYRPFDWDNAVAAFKAGQDGLVRGGALIGDGRDQLEGGRVSFDPTVGPWVRVTLEAIP